MWEAMLAVENGYWMTIWNRSDLPAQETSVVFSDAVLQFKTSWLIYYLTDGEDIEMLNNWIFQCYECIALVMYYVDEADVSRKDKMNLQVAMCIYNDCVASDTV